MGRTNKNVDKDQIKSVLLISLSNLGDIILTTPVLQKLSIEFPGVPIDVMCGPPGKEVFTNHPAVREVIVTRGHRSFSSRMKDIRYLRSKHYDLVVDLKKTIMPFLLGTKVRAGGMRALVKGVVSHKREEHLAHLADIGIDADKPGFFVPVTIYDCRFIDEILKGAGGNNIVVLNPGSKSHLKRWGASRYAKLADKLVEELGCRVLVIGNDDDREEVDSFLARVKRPVENICGRTSIGELMELMRRVSLVITNDSAPLHMASAVNAPTIAIFGPTDERKYGPLSDRHRVLKPDVTCRPCEKALCGAGTDAGCISRVTVNEVFEAAKRMLG